MKTKIPIIIFYLFAVLLFSAQFTFAAKIITPVVPGPDDEAYLPFAEVMPEPEGGIPALYKKIKYPNIAKQSGLEGKVYVLIYVNENGGVDDVKIIKSLGGGCDEAAIDAVKQTKFIPGKNKGAAVKVKLSLSVTFKQS
ncbi:MAG: energy transducer TonB [Ignavibacteriaceae bacterium]|nr:energy transducer TonB [Ignavibacteriaceae bacterium]